MLQVAVHHAAPTPAILAAFHVSICIPSAFIPPAAIPTRSFLFLPPAARPSAPRHCRRPPPPVRPGLGRCPCCLLVPQLLLLPARSRPQLCAWLSLHNLFCVGSRKGVPGLERSGEAGTPFLKARRRAKIQGASGQQGVHLDSDCPARQTRIFGQHDCLAARRKDSPPVRPKPDGGSNANTQVGARWNDGAYAAAAACCCARANSVSGAMSASLGQTIVPASASARSCAK
jgi:hypothetical protein